MRTIFILFLIFPFSSFAKDMSCLDSKNIIEIAQKKHIINTKIDKKFVKKAVVNYIEFLDKKNVYLLQNEYNQILKNYPYEQVAVILNRNLSSNCTHVFKDIDNKIITGIKRYNEIVKNINLKKENKNHLKVNYRNGIEKRFDSLKKLKKAVSEIIQVEFSTDTEYLDRADFLESFLAKEDIFKNIPKIQYLTRVLIMSFDPHSDYYDSGSTKDLFGSLNNRIIGIGINYIPTLHGIKILNLIDSGPLYKTGKVSAGDMIVSIDGHTLENLSMKEASLLLSKSLGDTAVLKIRKNKKNPEFITELVSLIKKINAEENTDDISYEYETLEVQYQSIEIENLKIKTSLIEENNNKILYIKIPTFYTDPIKKTGTYLDTLNEYLKYKDKNLDAIMIDLRGNPGGYTNEAISLAGLFLGRRTIIMTKEKVKGNIFYSQLIADETLSMSPLIKEKLIVLTDKISASSSEIFIGAIKDYERGLIIGDKKTFGKGTIQEIDTALNSIDLGSLKITLGIFYRPNGHSNQIEGIEPDIILNTPLKNQDIGEKFTNFPIIVKPIDPSYDYDLKFYENRIKSFSKKYNFSEEFSEEGFLKKSIEIAMAFIKE